MKEKFVIRRIEAVIGSSSINQVFYIKVFWNKTAPYTCGKKVLQNYCKSVHLSAVTGLLPATLLKVNFFASIFFNFF